MPSHALEVASRHWQVSGATGNQQRLCRMNTSREAGSTVKPFLAKTVNGCIYGVHVCMFNMQVHTYTHIQVHVVVEETSVQTAMYAMLRHVIKPTRSYMFRYQKHTSCSVTQSRTYIYTHMYIYLCMYVCMYALIHIYVPQCINSCRRSSYV